MSDCSLELTKDHILEETLEFVEDDDLGNVENCKLFAEFKARSAGFTDLAITIRDDPSFHEE